MVLNIGKKLKRTLLKECGFWGNVILFVAFTLFCKLCMIISIQMGYWK